MVNILLPNGREVLLSVIEIEQALSQLSKEGRLIISSRSLPATMEGKATKIEAVIGSQAILHLEVAFVPIETMS